MAEAREVRKNFERFGVRRSARLTERGFRSKGEYAHSLTFEHESGEPVQLAFDPLFDPMIERAELLQFGELALRV